MKAEGRSHHSKVKFIRVSVGSAIVLGLLRGFLKAKPTTVYTLTYKEGKCLANCGFCPQARLSGGSPNMLSRVVWPPFPLLKAERAIAKAYSEGRVKRVCIQTLNYKEVVKDVLDILEGLRGISQIPISVSCQPVKAEDIVSFAEAGVDRIGIPIDAATKEIFDRVKGSGIGGPYRWDKLMETLKKAVDVFGVGRVSTHLIVGLGESEREMVQMVQWCVDTGITPSLFAFTPIKGTELEGMNQPPIEAYRRVQIARHLIVHGIVHLNDMGFDEFGRLKSFGVSVKKLLVISRSGMPFMTVGCPGCNRPFYNESIRGPIYNIPNVEIWNDIKVEELNRVRRLIR